PEAKLLRQGVRANGWVLLNEVSLGYEIWRQLNGFPAVYGDGDKSSDGKDGDKDKKKVKLPK
ncbi:MAG: hemolysin D, partial [Planctomycetota bacterium]